MCGTSGAGNGSYLPGPTLTNKLLQGIKKISVQSSVSLQHLPYDVALETSLPKEIEGKLSFATQKLHEIVKAKTPASKASSLTKALPEVGELPTATALCGMLPCLLLVLTWQEKAQLHALKLLWYGVQISQAIEPYNVFLKYTF